MARMARMARMAGIGKLKLANWMGIGMMFWNQIIMEILELSNSGLKWSEKIGRYCKIDGILTVVDGVHFLDQLARERPEGTAGILRFTVEGVPFGHQTWQTWQVPM